MSAFLEFKHGIADKVVFSKIRQRMGGNVRDKVKWTVVICGFVTSPTHLLLPACLIYVYVSNTCLSCFDAIAAIHGFRWSCDQLECVTVF